MATKVNFKFDDNLPWAFRLKCSRTLNLELGRFDAIVEVTELAIRQFLAQAGNEFHLNKYVKIKGREFHVNVQHLKKEILMTRVSHSYIASTYQYFEFYLYSFTKEYERLFDKELEFGDSNDNYLEKLLKQVQQHQIKDNKNDRDIEDSIGADIIAAIAYYKTVRNKYSHYYQIKDDKVTKAFANVNRFNSELLDKFATLPSEYDKCSFEDFLLFTRAVRFFNRRISDYIKPKHDRFFLNYLAKENQFNKVIQNPERLLNAKVNFLKIEFGINDVEAKQIVLLA